MLNEVIKLEELNNLEKRLKLLKIFEWSNWVVAGALFLKAVNTPWGFECFIWYFSTFLAMVLGKKLNDYVVRFRKSIEKIENTFEDLDSFLDSEVESD